MTVKAGETLYKNNFNVFLYDVIPDYYAYDYVKTLNYDLINGKKIENFSDLFYKDINFIQTVNEGVADRINTIPPMAVKSDFLGITGSIENFSVNRLYIGKDNPYLTDNFGKGFSVDNLKLMRRFYRIYIDDQIGETVFPESHHPNRPNKNAASISDYLPNNLIQDDPSNIQTILSKDLYHKLLLADLFVLLRQCSYLFHNKYKPWQD